MPLVCHVVINTYRQPSNLYVEGECIHSNEGTTQGDPIAKPLYAIGVVPLIREIVTPGACQLWYADDSYAGGRLVPLRTWWDKLHDRGPDFGYFLNPAKSVLVVKPDDYHEAVQLFDGTGIRITATGIHYLDSAIGTPAFVEDYVHEKARDWCGQVESLTSTALPPPQAAYSAFTQGLSSRWSFLCQVLEGASAGLASLERVIATKLLPALTGQEISSELRTLFSFPCRNGGLGILDPTSLSAQYQSSRAITAPMVANILTQSFNLGDSLAEVASLKASNGKDVKAAATEALRQFTARASLPTSTPSTLAVGHVRPADSRVAPSVGMGSACRSVNFAMVWHCGMVGTRHGSLLLVSVVPPSLLSMLSLASLVVSRRFATMRYGTSSLAN